MYFRDIVLLHPELFSQWLISSLGILTTEISSPAVAGELTRGWLRHQVIRRRPRAVVEARWGRVFPRLAIGVFRRFWEDAKQAFEEEAKIARQMPFHEFKKRYTEEYFTDIRLTAYAYSKEPRLLRFASPEASLSVMRIFLWQLSQGKRPKVFPLWYTPEYLRQNPKFRGTVYRLLVSADLPKKGTVVFMENHQRKYALLRKTELLPILLHIECFDW